MKMRASLGGMIAARKAFQKLPIAVQEQVNEATEATAYALALDARMRVPVDTGTLRNHITHRFSKRSGFAKVGIERGGVAIAGAGGSALTSKGARFLRPTQYAHLVEFGTSRVAARPFMLPSAEGQRVPYANRLKAAGRKVERQFSASRFL